MSCHGLSGSTAVTPPIQRRQSAVGTNSFYYNSYVIIHGILDLFQSPLSCLPETESGKLGAVELGLFNIVERKEETRQSF